MKKTVIYVLLLAVFVTGCGYSGHRNAEFEKEVCSVTPAQMDSAVWDKKVKEADSLSRCGYKDLDFDELEAFCFSKAEIRRPKEIDTIFYPRNESYPVELEWSFMVYKYGTDSDVYGKYVKAVSERHANGFY